MAYRLISYLIHFVIESQQRGFTR